MTAVAPAAVRRKVEAWLAESDQARAIALRTRPEWTGDPVLAVGDATVRVVPCPTPLAARAALYEWPDTERLVLLTELTDAELGDGLLAHLSRHTVRSVDPWDLVRQMFGGVGLDPTLAGAGRWAADALTEFAPPGGWPAPPGAVVTRDHALRCLAGALLGVDRDQIDSAGLLQWTTDAPAVLRFSRLPAAVLDGLTAFLVEVAGPVATPMMAAVRAGHGVDVIPLGLLCGVLWSPGKVSTDVAVARTRLEPRFGGTPLTDAQATAFRAVAEAWVDRTGDSDSRPEAARMLVRAEAIAAEIHATGLLAGSSVLPTGFRQRLRAFAATVRAAVSAGPAGGPCGGAAGAADGVMRAQQALVTLEEHRAAESHRVETARMAVRLLRWLSESDDAAPATLLDALHRQVRVDGWVDRASLDVFAGDTDPEVAEAYRLLHRAVDARRAHHDEQFATLLAEATRGGADPGRMLRVEDVLECVVRPILDHGRQVLLLVLDGMSVAAATELAESLTRSGAWLELTPDGGPRTGVLAALPTLTEVSRCSLFSGRIAVGGQPAERRALAERFRGAQLLHKSGLRAGGGAALDPELVAALADPGQRLIAAVVNTIDDALDRSDPGTVEWSTDTIPAVRDLTALAQDRVVVIVSDHGHVVDRGPDGVVRPSAGSDNRWRPADPPAGEGEIVVSGARVAKAGGTVVLPWREELRYGPRKAGYHGGAAAAEVVIPLLVFSAGDEHAVPGWSGAPVASPNWWREPLLPAELPPAAGAAPTRGGPLRPAPSGPVGPPTRSPTRPPAQPDALFDLISTLDTVSPVRTAPVPASGPVPSAAGPSVSAPGRPSLVDALLASAVYAQRRGTRAPLPDERVAALLGVLLAGNGRAMMETLAAHAQVPAHRIGSAVTALRRLLQVEGYPVLDLDPDGRTVRLDVALLVEQFRLEVPT